MFCDPGYVKSPLVPKPWSQQTSLPANVVQKKIGNDTYIGTVATDYCNSKVMNPLIQQYDEAQNPKFKLAIGNEGVFSEKNLVCVQCTLDCGSHGTCAFDSDGNQFCDCETVITRDCYGASNDNSSTTREFPLKYTGAVCQFPPAGLPRGFVLNFHQGSHGHCAAETPPGMACAPGLYGLKCAGSDIIASVCGVLNSTDDHQCRPN